QFSKGNLLRILLSCHSLEQQEHQFTTFTIHIASVFFIFIFQQNSDEAFTYFLLVTIVTAARFNLTHLL
ncbi:hypothetical protein, partial [Paenibacillus rigui]